MTELVILTTSLTFSSSLDPPESNCINKRPHVYRLLLAEFRPFFQETFLLGFVERESVIV